MWKAHEGNNASVCVRAQGYRSAYQLAYPLFNSTLNIIDFRWCQNSSFPVTGFRCRKWASRSFRLFDDVYNLIENVWRNAKSNLIPKVADKILFSPSCFRSGFHTVVTVYVSAAFIDLSNINSFLQWFYLGLHRTVKNKEAASESFTVYLHFHRKVFEYVDIINL